MYGAPDPSFKPRKNRLECTVTGGMRGSLILNSLSSPTLKHTWSAGRTVVQCVVTTSPCVDEPTSLPMLASR
jgi:hypothetical protein